MSLILGHGVCSTVGWQITVHWVNWSHMAGDAHSSETGVPLQAFNICFFYNVHTQLSLTLKLPSRTTEISPNIRTTSSYLYVLSVSQAASRIVIISRPRYLHQTCYTPRVKKNMPPNFCLYLHQILTDFKISFTGTLCGKFAVTQLLNIPPHLYCIATLPCEI